MNALQLSVPEIIAIQEAKVRLEGEVKMLREALQEVLPYVVIQVVACNGLKCRESVCESCTFEADVNAQKACDKYAKCIDALSMTKAK